MSHLDGFYIVKDVFKAWYEESNMKGFRLLKGNGSGYVVALKMIGMNYFSVTGKFWVWGIYHGGMTH